MLKIGDKFQVHFDYMNEGEVQEGVVDEIIEEDGEIQFWDTKQSIYTTNEGLKDGTFKNN